MLVKLHGIVLKSVDFSEADRIITVFTREEGLVTIFAKGVRKLTSKNRSGVQTLSYNSFNVFQGKNMYSLRRAENLYTPDYNEIHDDNIHRVLKLMLKMIPEGTREVEVFDLFLKLLHSNFDNVSVNKFRLLALKNFGHMPDSNMCAVCGRQERESGNVSAKLRSDAVITHVDLMNFSYVCSKCAAEVNAEGAAKHLDVSPRLVPIETLGYGDSELTNAIDVYIDVLLES